MAAFTAVRTCSTELRGLLWQAPDGQPADELCNQVAHDSDIGEESQGPSVATVSGDAGAVVSPSAPPSAFSETAVPAEQIEEGFTDDADAAGSGGDGVGGPASAVSPCHAISASALPAEPGAIGSCGSDAGDRDFAAELAEVEAELAVLDSQVAAVAEAAAATAAKWNTGQALVHEDHG